VKKMRIIYWRIMASHKPGTHEFYQQCVAPPFVGPRFGKKAPPSRWFHFHIQSRAKLLYRLEAKACQTGLLASAPMWPSISRLARICDKNCTRIGRVGRISGSKRPQWGIILCFCADMDGGDCGTDMVHRISHDVLAAHQHQKACHQPAQAKGQQSKPSLAAVDNKSGTKRC